MEFGVGYFPTHDSLGPDLVAALVEEHGQDALVFAEHTHIPASRETEHPAGIELPAKYSHTYDLFVSLTAAALATSRLRIGSGICLLIEHDPIVAAKAVASIDHLSGGRLDFGIGAGWNREEMRNHGTDPRTRMRLLGERIEACKAIWSQDEASFHGEFVNFDRIWSWPKPAQRPHPPILVGGSGPTVEDRVVAYGDAWFPNYGEVKDDLEARWKTIQDRAGRPLELHLMGMPARADALEFAANAGVTRASRWLPSGGRAVVEDALGHWEKVIAEWNGEI